MMSASASFRKRLADIVGSGDSHGLARGVAKNGYTTRTTLWGDEDSAGAAAPQARGAWRAPSAVLAGDRGRRVVSAMPAIEDEADELRQPPRVPRRTRFPAVRTPWWRPKSTFGRSLLAMAALLVLGAAVTLGVITRNFLIRDRHFRIPGVASIQSMGLSEINRSEILPVFGEDIGRNIFFVPLSARRKQLEAIPWVQQATVMRFLPNRLSVSIVERTPVAFVREGSAVELADADGVVLSMPPLMMAQHHYSFPVVTGIDAQDSLASRRARMAVYLRFLADLDRNHQHLTEQVSEIDLSDPEDLRATMPEQGSDILAHFGEDHFLERWQTYKSHIGEWRSRYPRLIGVDLRYSGEIPLEMAPDVSAAANSAKIEAPAKAAQPVKPERSAVKLNPAKSTSVSNTNKSAAARRAAEARKRAARLKAAHDKALRKQAQ